jgi:hypothetical protein
LFHGQVETIDYKTGTTSSESVVFKIDTSTGNAWRFFSSFKNDEAREGWVVTELYSK